MEKDTYLAIEGDDQAILSCLALDDINLHATQFALTIVVQHSCLLLVQTTVHARHSLPPICSKLMVCLCLTMHAG